MTPALDDLIEIYNLNSRSTLDVARDYHSTVIPRMGETIYVQDINGIIWTFIVKTVQYEYRTLNEYIEGYDGTRVLLCKITIYCEELG